MGKGDGNAERVRRLWSIARRRLKGETWKVIIHLATRIEHFCTFILGSFFSSFARNLQVNGWSDTVICLDQTVRLPTNWDCDTWGLAIDMLIWVLDFKLTFINKL